MKTNTSHIIAGKFRGRKLHTIHGDQTRPTMSQVREAVFNICINEVVGSRFLDLFAGSGAISLEAISRGAEHATLIEIARSAVSTIVKNIDEFDLKKQTRVLQRDAKSALVKLAREKERFDIIYIDPPYGKQTLIEEIVAQIIDANMLEDCGILFIENTAKSALPKVSEKLKLIRDKEYGSTRLLVYRY